MSAIIISPGRGHIFVHIPKTGGTSMALALEGRAKKDDILIGDTPKALRRRRRLKGVEAAGRLWKHSTLSDIHGLLTLDEIRAAFCFTMVRHPRGRAVSYYHWLRAQSFDHPAVRLAQSATFSEFLNDGQTQAAFRQNTYAHAMTAIDGQLDANLFIRLENLEEDAASLWRHLGFRLDLPHENAPERTKTIVPIFPTPMLEPSQSAVQTTSRALPTAFEPSSLQILKEISKAAPTGAGFATMPHFGHFPDQ